MKLNRFIVGDAVSVLNSRFPDEFFDLTDTSPPYDNLKITKVIFLMPNQTRKDGLTIYRPTCVDCRQGVDGVKNHETRKDGTIPVEPTKGSFWCCLICEKKGTVGVTVKLVLDHGHLIGDARDYICDSCNTGLGRFRNGKNFLKNAVAFLEKWD